MSNESDCETRVEIFRQRFIQCHSGGNQVFLKQNTYTKRIKSREGGVWICTSI